VPSEDYNTVVHFIYKARQECEACFLALRLVVV
jgi:hypothetical protein